MRFSGLLLKESLAGPAAPDTLTITQTETWEIERPADWQPGVWAAITFEGPEAGRIQRAARSHNAPPLGCRKPGRATGRLAIPALLRAS